MKILYDELAIAINDPTQKHYHVGIQYVRNYQETIKFIKGNYPDYYCRQYDLFLLEKKIETLSKDDLIDWQLEAALVKGSLSRIEEEVGD